MRSKGLLIVASAHQLPLASGLFHCVVTSPPYFGLRDYAGEQAIEWPTVFYQPLAGDTETFYIDKWSGALGFEPTIEMYIGHMVLVCREIKRVLRDDGTFWLNVGDSYNGSGGLGTTPGFSNRHGELPHYGGRNLPNLQAGDLIFMPQRLALALQADGWIVRNDNPWSKHAMPEPRKGWRWEKPPCDCVTKKREAHITKQMFEQGTDRHRIFDKAGTKFKPDPECPKCHGEGRYGNERFIPESWRHTRSHEVVFQLTKKMNYYSDHTRVKTATGANPRSVLTSQRSNYPGKHFAVFPPHLIAPLIHASTPRECCPGCGQPYAPVIERIQGEEIPSISLAKEINPHKGGPSYRPTISEKVKAYIPTCRCLEVKPVPGIVLDPFMGSGTTGMVAKEWGVNFVGVDISFQYLDEQAKIRTKTGQPSGALDGLPLLEGLENVDGS